MDWLFEQYNNKGVNVVESDNQDKYDARIARFMPSHQINEIKHFLDDLAKLMESALGWLVT